MSTLTLYLQHKTTINKNQQDTKLNEKQTANGYNRQVQTCQEELSKNKISQTKAQDKDEENRTRRASERQRIQARPPRIHVIDEQKISDIKTSISIQLSQFESMRISPWPK